MIGQAIGEVLAFGVGVALSPLAIVALVVMLVSPDGARAAWVFAGAWMLSLGLACAVVAAARRWRRCERERRAGDVGERG